MSRRRPRLSRSGGYPYFLQELGYAVWTVADGPTITREDVVAAIPGYEAKLDESFFRVRLDRATDLTAVAMTVIGVVIALALRRR